MPARSRVVRDALPDDEGMHDGLAWSLFRPSTPPVGAVVVLHGADSRKESHFGFARAGRARGIAALAFDLRGHGASPGALDGRVLDDVQNMVRCAGRMTADVRSAPLPVALRGSSMGGWLAICAARAARVQAVVAICPATSDGLRRGLRDGRFGFAADVPALQEVLASTTPADEVPGLGERLLLLHARGDEQVPVEHSEELHRRSPGSRLVVVPGGHHRTAQHDPELEALSVRFLRRALEPGPR